MSPKKQLGAIDEDLLRRVDEAAGDVPRVRWVERALEQALGDGVTTPEKSTAVHDRPPASPRASELPPASEVKWLEVPPLPERECERCAKPYTSPTLRRCNVCNGRILPEPE